MNVILAKSRRHLGDLLEACQRCVWHLEAERAPGMVSPLAVSHLLERAVPSFAFVVRGCGWR